MRILIIGFVVFVIWSLFSVWLYVDKLKPALNEPIVVQPIPETITSAADTTVLETVVAPGDLIVYFDFDVFSFNPEMLPDSSIAEFKTWLDNNPQSTLLITGHTDYKGTSEYNQKLGMKRALSVERHFISKEIAEDKISSNSAGEDQPASDLDSEEGRAKNRRTVITIKN